MQVIKPVSITDSNLVTTIAEPDLTQGEVEWDGLRVNHYALSASPTAIVANEDRVYITSGANLGHQGVDVFDKSGNFIEEVSNIPDDYYLGIATDGDSLFMANQVNSTLLTIEEVLIDGYVRTNHNITLPSAYLEAGRSLFYKDGLLYVSAYNSDTDIKLLAYTVSDFLLNETFDLSPVIDRGITSMSYTDRFIINCGGRIYYTDDEFTEAESYKYAKLNNSSATCIFYDLDRFWAVSNNAPGSVKQYGFLSLDFVDKIGLYVAGEQAVKISTHKIYQAATDTTDDPEVGVNLEPPSWVEVSATNKYRAFDYVKNAKAVSASPLVYEFTPNQIISALAVFNVSGMTTVNITMTDPFDGVVYDKDIELADVGGIINMWRYFLYQPALIDNFVVDDLPAYKLATTKITFSGGVDSSVGEIAIGLSRVIGEMVDGTSTDRKSFSTITVDSFGSETITKRPTATYTSFMVSLTTSTAAYVERVLKEVIDEPTLFIGDDVDNIKLVDLGYYERSPLVRENQSFSTINLKVRGLV